MLIEYSKPNNIKPHSGEMNFAIHLQIAQRNSKVSGRESNIEPTKYQDKKFNN